MKGKKSHTPKYNSASRYSGSQRTVIVNRYNNSYGGYYFADPYNHSLIFSFSTIWWYHHWATVDRSHYASDARMRQLESEVAALKAKNTPVDTNYQDNMILFWVLLTCLVGAGAVIVIKRKSAK